MDYLKTDAPLWKKETGAQGTRWIEPRAEDRARRAQAEGKTL
jgi:molybdopterin synthase catalytic subunit